MVSKVLGHSNPGTTADIYAHFTRSLVERAASRMDAVLEASAGG